MAGAPQNDRFLEIAYEARTTDETRDLYDRWAETYDTELIDENDYAQPLRCAEMLSRYLTDRLAQILDVGCGTGLSGAALSEAGYRTIDGCDLSPGMLAKARGTGVYRRLFEADLNVPPLDAGDGAYGAAAAVGVFSFSHVQPDALDDILRVLAPGAPLIIGLNEHFYDEGTLTGKLDVLNAAGRIERLTEEHGDHIRGTGVTGWVIAVRKTSATSA
ncbi:MAG: methyltransferase domain-containing protein [Rhodospirillaceae bacterium]|nr:methyltransferase domain-containing protein [Rhodospirillaceae bacterium]